MTVADRDLSDDDVDLCEGCKIQILASFKRKAKKLKGHDFDMLLLDNGLSSGTLAPFEPEPEKVAVVFDYKTSSKEP